MSYYQVPTCVMWIKSNETTDIIIISKLYRFKLFTAIAVIFFSAGIFDDYVNLM